MLKIFDSVLVEDWDKIIRWIIQHHGSKNNYYLTGDLGAGKTTFVRTFAALLGSDSLVTSPSFTLMNIYHYPAGKIYHLDLYRLATEEEVYEIGLDEILAEPETKFIEWANLFPAFIKKGVRIDFYLNPDCSRKIQIQEV